jgi:hypothetical protein
MYLFIYLFIYLLIHLFMHIYLFIYLFIYYLQLVTYLEFLSLLLSFSYFPHNYWLKSQRFNRVRKIFWSQWKWKHFISDIILGPTLI